jgi:hypothetical protein
MKSLGQVREWTLRVGVGAALALVLAFAVPASASIYSSLPKTGKWQGQSGGNPISFKVTKRGHRFLVKRFTASVPYYCQPENGQAALAGRLTLTWGGPMRVDSNAQSDSRGEFGFPKPVTITAPVPGTSQPVAFSLYGEFHSHRQYPPPGKLASGLLRGAWNTDAGDYCGLGIDSESGETFPIVTVEWEAHASKRG